VSGKSDWVEDQSDHATPLTPQHSEGSVPLQATVTRSDDSSSNNTPLYPIRAPLAPPHSVRLSSSTYKDWLVATHKNLPAILPSKDKILELQGTWDDAGHALHGFGLTYTRIPPSQLSAKRLFNVKVMIVDCGCNLAPGNAPLIQQFVESGGHLITTDWALDSCLSRCFPGFLEANGNYSEASIVDATLVCPDAELTSGTTSPTFWKLEKRSQFVRQLSPQVEVVARSRGVLRQDPWGQGILAACFNYGRGRVLHLVGHFDTNSTGAFTNELVDPSPGIVVSLRQAIAANFVISALTSGAPSQRSDEAAAEDK
jgi:hypothetical protein